MFLVLLFLYIDYSCSFSTTTAVPQWIRVLTTVTCYSYAAQPRTPDGRQGCANMPASGDSEQASPHSLRCTGWAPSFLPRDQNQWALFSVIIFNFLTGFPLCATWRQLTAFPILPCALVIARGQLTLGCANALMVAAFSSQCIRSAVGCQWT